VDESLLKIVLNNYDDFRLENLTSQPASTNKPSLKIIDKLHFIPVFRVA
jgi:RimJ/RimL family protein N-acetyltransferase